MRWIETPHIIQQCSVSCAALRSRKQTRLRRVRLQTKPPSRRYQHDPLPTSPWTTSFRTSMDKAGLSKPLRHTSALSWQTRPTLRSRRSKTLPQRADRSASRHRADTSARRWTASTSSSSTPVTTSRSAALRRRAGRPVTAARRRPTSRRRPRRIIRPGIVSDFEARRQHAWPTLRPAGSVRGRLRGPPTACAADFKVRRQRAWPTLRPAGSVRGRLQGPQGSGRLQGPPTACVADFKAPRGVADFKARRQRAWPTSRPADSARGRPSIPASCVADVRPVQAEAERKHKRRRCRSRGGAGRTSSVCPHYMAPKEAQSNGQHPARARMKARECRASARARSANLNSV